MQLIALPWIRTTVRISGLAEAEDQVYYLGSSELTQPKFAGEQDVYAPVCLYRFV
jgi:hypothetical protein